MLTGDSLPDDALSQARACAARGDWAAVRAVLAPEGSVRAIQPEASVLLAEAALRLAEPRTARHILTDAVPLLEKRVGGALLRRAINLLGAACFELGELDEAGDAFDRVLQLATRDGDDLLTARATNNLGIIANIRGRRDAALALYRLAIPAYQRLGNTQGLAESFHNIAITYRDARQLELSDEYERRAIEFAREAGSRRLQAMARVRRAELSLLRGDARLAAAEADRAGRDAAEIREPVTEADALRLGGSARAELGEIDAAFGAFTRALELARTHGNALVEAESLGARARLHDRRGDTADARANASQAMVIYEKLGNREESDRLASIAAGG